MWDVLEDGSQVECGRCYGLKTRSSRPACSRDSLLKLGLDFAVAVKVAQGRIRLAFHAQELQRGASDPLLQCIPGACTDLKYRDKRKVLGRAVVGGTCGVGWCSAFLICAQLDFRLENSVLAQGRGQYL